MSSKELGQIHTVNKRISFLAALEGATPFVAGDIDIPWELSQQMQRMVRQGNFFKVVGIDISLGLDQDLNQSCSVSGFLRYYAPTKGRCKAYRDAFKAMAEQMKNQGISMRDNELYDFRAPINELNTTFPNQATLDGTNGLALNHLTTSRSIFGVHNNGVRPTYTGTDPALFSEGFETLLSPAGTDFVLNDEPPFSGNELEASTQYELIPFTLQFGDSDESSTLSFQWRPDPALYLAVMCGQLQVYITDLNVQSSINLEQIEMNFAVMVSGWKSIMGNPDKKKKSGRRSRKKR